MFDKYLCRKIHKKAITVSDIFVYFLDKVFPNPVKITGFTILGGLLVKLYSSSLQISFWQGFKVIVQGLLTGAGIVIIGLVLFFLFLHVCEKIGKIKVAECPLSKAEEEEEEEEKE